jgi:hypothetical protein
VVKGAAGRRVYGFDSTLCTPRGTDGSRSASASASAVDASSGRESFFSAPLSSKSRPVAMRAPSMRTSRASNGSSCSIGDSDAVRSQYDAVTKASRSRSRSTTRRVAADCTRPADRPGPTLRQRTGDTS